MKSVKLGDKVKDSITGSVGTVTAIIEYIGGRVRCCVETQVNGKPEEFWLDVSRLDLAS